MKSKLGQCVWFCFFLTLVFSLCAPFCVADNVFYDLEDSGWVDSWFGAYGKSSASEDDVWVGDAVTAAPRRGWLEFNCDDWILNHSGHQIDRIWLWIYVTDAGNARSISIYKLQGLAGAPIHSYTGNSVGEIIWKAMDGVGNGNTWITGEQTPTSTGWKKLLVSAALFNDPWSVGSGGVGLGIKDDGDNDDEFIFDGHGSANPARLEIVYTDPTPGVPQDVNASDGAYTDRVYIYWTGGMGASHYRVYRATSSGGTKTALGSWQTSLTYNDYSANIGQTYYYWVKAATSSSGDNPTAYSSYNTGYRALANPDTPSASDGTYTDRVRITWDSVTGATYYRVYRATSSGGTKTALGSWQTGTSYDDTGATPGQTYYYWVSAGTSSSGAHESGRSYWDTGYRTLSAPTGVIATDGTYSDRVSVSWNNVSGASHYQVYRATSAGGTKTAISSWQTGGYGDYSATPGQTYYYWVRAATSSGGANPSDYSSYNTGYRATPGVTLSYITISGETSVNEGSTEQYTCTANYSDGSSANVSSSASWSENSSYASINSSGYLTTASVSSDQPCRITATYGGKSDTHDVTIKDQSGTRNEVGYPCTFGGGTVCVYLWDNAAGDWVVAEDMDNPSELRSVDIQHDQYYWIGVWDYSESDWALQEWFGCFNTVENGHGRFVGHLWSVADSTVELPTDSIEIGREGHTIWPVVVNLSTGDWDYQLPQFVSDGVYEFAAGSWNTWYWIVFYDLNASEWF